MSPSPMPPDKRKPDSKKYDEFADTMVGLALRQVILKNIGLLAIPFSSSIMCANRE